MENNMTLKNSKNIIMALFLLSLLTSTTYAAKKRGVYATKNLIGQDYYIKRCSSCHGEGSRGGNMASIREWKQIFSQNAAELIDLHVDDEESINVVKYLKSETFKKESKLMLEFLQEFAYDSENIPTCN